jgi:hypothetical protein
MGGLEGGLGGCWEGRFGVISAQKSHSLYPADNQTNIRGAFLGNSGALDLT